MGTVTEHRSYCRFCEALCGILVEVDGDRVVGVRGDPAHPLSQGYTCPKGRSLGAFHHSPARLDVPLVRRDGALQPTTWEACHADLAARIRRVVEEHGPDAVGVYVGTGAAFDPAGRRMARKLLIALGSRSFYTSASIDAPCKPLVGELMGGHPFLIPLIDDERPGLRLLVGSNPVVSHGHLNAYPNPRARLRRLAEQGELWVVDPRRTETARLATRHLAPRPGTDYAWLAHLVRELLDDADGEALRARADGVERLAAAVAPFDRDTTLRLTGLAGDDLDDLLAAIRRWGRLAGQTGTGTTMAPSANLTEWLLWALHVVTDSFDRPGGAWFNPGALAGFDRRRRRPGDGSPEPGSASRPDMPGRWGELPAGALADEIESGALRVLLVHGGNLLTALPDAARVARALPQLEVLAVCDVVETATTRAATHVLPATGQLERADLPSFVDLLQPAVVAQYTPAVVPPGAQRRPAWRVFAQLARDLGHDLLGGLDPAQAGDDDALAPLARHGHLPLEALKAADGPVIASGPVFGWVRDVLPEGRWRIAPAPLVEQLATLPTPPPLALVPRRQLRHVNSELAGDGTADGRRDTPDLLVHPDDAAAAGIRDGAEVVVRSGHGEVTAVAVVTDDIRPGAVSLPHGYAETNVNLLSTAGERVDPLTGMVTFSSVPVTLTPAAPAAPPAAVSAQRT